jgi:hypothetical protein
MVTHLRKRNNYFGRQVPVFANPAQDPGKILKDPETGSREISKFTKFNSFNSHPVSKIIWTEIRFRFSSTISGSYIYCKKRLSFFPSPAGMSLTILSLAGNNLIIPA